MQPDRHFLTATGAALLDQRGSAARRRANQLTAAVGQCDPASLSFEELAATPAWLRAPRTAQVDMARRVALLAIGPALAGSIDGAWLAGLAEAAGEDALDWAIARHEEDVAEEGAPVGPITGPELAPTGFAILALTMPAPLRPLTDWAAPETRADVTTAQAARWLAVSEEAIA